MMRRLSDSIALMAAVGGLYLAAVAFVVIAA
jgi:hypothetical protein